ncbi:LytR/AlgR family response regulator transcription factor [Aquimarina algiphila]|uniref:LytR/AlgR family response regulator transcription factor n=1 Tax=Aquimarina algiphila TaxID=2047982 RepID=UPI00190EF617|nr:MULTISPECIES: LytTR family DNA-binding domain-containing protein [Aquimarina]
MKHPLIQCAVVDDSTTQRLSVIKLIKKHPRLELAKEWNNAIEAKNGLLDTKIDVLFLDIEMPILNGFDLLDDLENKPHIIFVTGKTKYAHKAFDYHALDFLKKPIRKERFNIAIEKVIDTFTIKSQPLPQENDPFVFIKCGIKKYKVFLNHILYVSALKDFAKIHLEDSSPLVVLGTMTSLESLLPSNHFFRAHRSYIVNLDKIERFSAHYMEINDEKIPISRMKKQKLKEALNHL